MTTIAGPDDAVLAARTIADTRDRLRIEGDGSMKWNQNGTTADTTTPVLGMYQLGTISVTVPSITDPDIAKVDVDVSAAVPGVAVGDAVIAIPLVALPTNCRLQGAYVTATDVVTVVFGSEGGNVTGAAKNFTFLLVDLT